MAIDQPRRLDAPAQCVLWEKPDLLCEPLKELKGLTVEHLLPQNGRIEDYPCAPMPEHEVDVSPEARRKRLLHTIGNLTLLTGPLNTSISNGPFSAKRKAIVDESDLRLNAWMRTDARTTWSETDILQRGADLFERAARIWPVPNRTILPVGTDAAVKQDPSTLPIPVRSGGVG